MDNLRVRSTSSREEEETEPGSIIGTGNEEAKSKLLDIYKLVW